MLHGALGFAHDGLHALLRFPLAPRAEEESHAAARHAAQHPESPEILAEFGARAADQGVGIEVAGPRNDGLYGPVEILLGTRPDGADITRLQVAHYLIQYGDRLLAAEPFRFRAQQVFLGHHLQDGPHVLRHAAVHQHQALLQFLARGLIHAVEAEDLVVGQQASAADAEFRIALARLDPVDQLDAGPDAAGIPTSCAMPPCTSTRLCCNFSRVD